MKKYLISEFDGRFSIMVETEIVKGMWWWKKKVKTWAPADIDGNETIFTQPSFSTIDAAINKVKSWQKGVTIHKL